MTREDRVFLWQIAGGCVAGAMVVYAFQDTLMHPAMGILGLAPIARVAFMITADGWRFDYISVDKRD